MSTDLKAKSKAIFYKMYFLRRFEEKAGQCYLQKQIGGFCHLYIGQEAVAVGTYEAIQKGDQVITGYRDHAHIILAGAEPKKVMAELFGKETGVSKGKGGSMHLFDVENHFYGGHGIVGAQVSIGTGLAFANKYNKNKNASIVFFGDGATHQGQVYESFNMAKLWNLPVVYVIENNEYAMGTSVQRSSSIQELYKRGESFNIEGKMVDGMNIFEVEKAMKTALEHAKSGKGPVLLEMKTYRYRGHSMSDPAKYRTREEVDSVRDARDPIEQFMRNLPKSEMLTESEIKEIKDKVEQEVNECVEFAEASSFPDLKELYTNVYTE